MATLEILRKHIVERYGEDSDLIPLLDIAQQQILDAHEEIRDLKKRNVNLLRRQFS